MAWRIAHLLNAEDGPGEIIVRLRRAAGSSVLGEAMDRFSCASVWIAAPLAFRLGDDWAEQAMLWPAISAGAILIERLGPREPEDDTISDSENEGKAIENGMLR